MNVNNTSNYIVENRPYYEDSTSEEILALQNRISIYSPQIIYFEEVPMMTPFSVHTTFDQFEKLGVQLGRHGLLIDVRKAGKPDAKTRRVINNRFTKICQSVDHVAFCSGQNILLNTVIHFVMHHTNLDSFSIHKTFEAAIKAIESKLDE